MHFGTKSYLKSTHNHTTKHAYSSLPRKESRKAWLRKIIYREKNKFKKYLTVGNFLLWLDMREGKWQWRALSLRMSWES